MTGHLLLFQHNKTYYSAFYTTTDLSSLTVLPANTIHITVTLSFNNILLQEDEYDMLTGKIMHRLSSMSLWHSLGYDVTVTVDGNANSVLQLTCHIKPAIDLQGAPDTSIILLEQIHLEFGIYSNDVVTTDSLYQGIHHLVVSMVLHWEHRFPLVFSVFGRAFFRLNYGDTVRCTDEILRLEKSHFKRNVGDRESMLAVAITRMANYIQTHLTTIEMWKTSNSNSKIKSLKANRSRAPPTILQSVYLLQW